MSWKKVCPGCGNRNFPMAEFCTNCDYDLSGVSPQNLPDTPEASVPAAPAAPAAPETPAATGFQPPKPAPQAALKQFKLCPGCGRKNPPLASICECEFDLYSVPVTKEGDTPPRRRSAQPAPVGDGAAAAAPASPAAAPAASPAAPAAPAKNRPVRRCGSCGELNPLIQMRCQKCGADISMAIPTVVSAANWKVQIRGGQDSLSFSDGDRYTVGRNSSLSCSLMSSGFVSGQHIELFCEGEKLFVTHLSRTNPTLVNGRDISQAAGGRAELAPGDIICMGGRPGQGDTPMAGYLVVSRD